MVTDFDGFPLRETGTSPLSGFYLLLFSPRTFPEDVLATVTLSESAPMSRYEVHGQVRSQEVSPGIEIHSHRLGTGIRHWAFLRHIQNMTEVLNQNF
jgi:hypothetical protein